ncbi:hypothetical protein [Amaricoccus sp.]|uniref:hypothetical protein n=1 Tax=Amaricoccus sp. TaxID=1872485 RepID=UPI001B6032CF|nr:hypothetical protein [Amaricoccus sp.]MBP7002873.1 hypothetical protein [Amaricoccus sp.]
MAFEALKVQIARILDEIERQPEDPHALQESLREKLAEMRDLGLPLPQDLVELEAALEQGLELPALDGEPDEEA